MNISKIEIKNFKSFKDISVDLNEFNVIVGASASGKSNFIEAIQFLKDISYDFENGIAKHGGQFFQNVNLNSTTPSCIRLIFSDNKSFLERSYSKYKLKYTTIDYELCINFKQSSKSITETVKFNFNVFDMDDKEISQNTLILINQNWNIVAKFLKEDKNLILEDLIPQSVLNIVNENQKEKQQLIINSLLVSSPFLWSDLFKTISCYNFNPKYCLIDDNNENPKLNHYGENLTGVIEKILSNEDDKRTFLNLVSMLLSYINDINILKLEDNRKIFSLSEKYNKSAILSPFVSDGTLNLLALVCVLYFDSSNIVLIEEPERNIHPALFIQIVEMMKEVSNTKQIIISTHSPEILNFCNLENIYLFSRKNGGYSKISKPNDNKDLKIFIDELGIGQVFVDDYLEFGNE